MCKIFVIALLISATVILPISDHIQTDSTKSLQIPERGSWIGNDDPTWKQGWTNIVPPGRGQSFIPKGSNIFSVEVALLTGNTGGSSDTITMKIVSLEGKVLTEIARTVDSGFDGWLKFEIPDEGLKVEVGKKLIMTLQDTGTVIFGWKYGPDKYQEGNAILNKKERKEYDFLFRVNHQKQ